MEKQIPQTERVYPLKVDEYGRFVIPADSKIRQACRAGEQVVAIEGMDGSLAIKRYADMVRDVQAYFKPRIPEGVSLVDQLLSERREEASRE